MRRGPRLRFPALAALLGFALAAPVGSASEPSRLAFTSLASDFGAFYDQSREQPEAERVAAFRTRFNALFPGYYEPRNGRTEAQYDALVVRALNGFPAARDRFEDVSARFPHILAAGVAHFQRTFPGFKPDVPIYLVHSLGEMDGGTRTIRRRNVMIFGADVIARLHDDETIGPFFNHELFHILHSRFHPDCGRIRCALWQEGLATYAASVMNDTADPHLLMLDTPLPIVPAVDADMAGALCLVRAKLEATHQADYVPIFFGGTRTPDDPFPRRFGYYVGYLVAKEAARTMPLAELTRLSPLQARPLLEASLNKLIAREGGCAGRELAP